MAQACARALDPETRQQAAVGAYLKAHPLVRVAGQGTIQPQFQDHPAVATPVVECLLRDETLWFVRWPNGSMRWETDAALIARGISLPIVPLVGVVGQF